MTKDVISLSISVLLLFRHYISYKITFGAPSSGGVLCSACGAFISVRLNIVERDLNQYKIVVHLVQHMLHQIKAQQFYTNFLLLISPLSQSSISEVEF